MRKAFALCLVAMLVAPSFSYAQAVSGTDRVLQGIPAIARAFAPLADVKWQEFAAVLAAICAVESQCNPTYLHYTKDGVYSQYQGLFQMNMFEVSKAEGELTRMLPQIRQLAQSGTVAPDVLKFVEDSVRAGEAMRGTNQDRRFHPSYGMILGATKHIQLNKQLAERYPGDPIRQAAGHMTAQFSGITEGKIRARNFNSYIGGAVNQVETEAWALGANGVQGQGTTVAGAIESAGSRYQSKMRAMVNRLIQVTGDLSLVLKEVAPFTAPIYQAGTRPLLGLPYNGVSTLMETGFLKPQVAPSIPMSGVPATPTPLQPTQTPTGVPENQQTPPTSQTKPSPFAAGIIVQPTTAKAGSSVLVSWATIGMQADSCTITERETVIARGVNGTERARVPLNATTLVYRLSCTAPGAQLPIVREAEVKVTP